jgi:inorganic pyrophosphatase/exopolyphosphatase
MAGKTLESARKKTRNTLGGLNTTCLCGSRNGTPTDREVALCLAGIAGVEVETFGEEMLAAGSALPSPTPESAMASTR